METRSDLPAGFPGVGAVFLRGDLVLDESLVSLGELFGFDCLVAVIDVQAEHGHRDDNRNKREGFG